MQNISSIQNAQVNAIAAVQAVLVVDSANARRGYVSFKPCDKSPVSKCPGESSETSTRITSESSLGQLSLTRGEGLGRLTSGPTGRAWWHDSHHMQMPATMWAAMVLNRQMCG